MGIRLRGRRIYFDFFDAGGNRHQPASPYVEGQEKEAQRELDIILRAIEAERALGLAGEIEPKLVGKGVTVEMWRRAWLKQRTKDKPQTAKEDKWKLERFIGPALDHEKLSELRPRHCRQFVLEMKARTNGDGTPALAPRSVRAIWSTLRTMLHDALAEELISQDPCILKRGDLPSAVDADPDWRSSAVYSREEVEQLISDARIPEYRRTLNGLLFLAGFRPSEAFALRWKHYDAGLEPLGRLDLMRAFNTNLRTEKDTKTGKRRLVPVHPTLAKLLAEWKLSGWGAHVGRKATPDDLLVPNPKGNHLRVDDAYDEMLGDQELLGWRKRRLYDSRRTFISLALGDGSDRDLLRWVTHGPKSGEVMDLYTSIPWAPICREVAKLKVSVRVSGRIVELRRTSGAPDCDSDCDNEPEGDKMLSNFQSRHPDLNRGPTDYEGVLASGTTWTNADNRKKSSGVVASPRLSAASKSGASVTLSHTEVRNALEEAADVWEVSHDVKGLRQKLAALLAALGGES